MPQLGGYELGNAELGAPTAPVYPSKNIVGLAKIVGTAARTITGVGNITTPTTPHTKQQLLPGKAWIGTPIVIESAQAYAQVNPVLSPQNVVRGANQPDTAAAALAVAASLVLTVTGLTAAALPLSASSIALIPASLTSASVTIGSTSATIVLDTSGAAPTTTAAPWSAATVVLDTSGGARTVSAVTFSAATLVYTSQPTSWAVSPFTTSPFALIIKQPIGGVTTPRIITAKAAIQTATQRTIGGFARIADTGTLTGRASILVTTQRTLAGKANLITPPEGQTISAVANLRFPSARITQIAQEVLQRGGSPKGRVTQVAREVLQLGGHPFGRVTQIAVEALVRLDVPLLNSQTISGKARIHVPGQQTISAVAHIALAATHSHMLSAVAHVLSATTRQQTISAVAHVLHPTFTTQTITGRANIQGQSSQTLTGKARVQGLDAPVITAVANIIPPAAGVWLTQAALEIVEDRTALPNQLLFTQEVLEWLALPPNTAYFTQAALEYSQYTPNVTRLTQTVLEVVVSGHRLCPLCLVPVNNESHPGIPWSGSGGGNQLFAGAHLFDANLYVLTNSWSYSGPSTNYFAEIWKSTDNGVTWTRLVLESALTAAEWNYTWTYFWNDGSNKITFFMAQTGRLVDFNLATETWSAPYAANWGSPPSGYTGISQSARIARLSDGRVMAFYSGINLAVRGKLCYAVANTSGSGVWDSIDNVLGPAGNPQALCVDNTNRSHVIYGTGSPVTLHYVNLDSSYTPSSVSDVPGSGSSCGNIIAAPDGKLYFSFLYPFSSFSVDLWVGDNFVSPAWTHEVVYDYGTSGVTYPAWAFVAWIAGEVTYFWDAFGGTPTRNHEIIEYSQRLSPGVWSPMSTWIDLWVTHPSPPLNDNGNGYWSTVGISAGDVSSGPNGFGVVVAIETGMPDGTWGWMAYYVGCCARGAGRNDYIALGNSLVGPGKYIV